MRRAAALLVAVALLGAAVADARTFRGSKRSERIVGTAGADHLSGYGGNDRIIGRAGDDRLSGGRGRDRLNGGAGFDTLLGGDADDVIDARDGGPDEIDCGSGDADVVLVDAEEEGVRDCEDVRFPE